MKTLFTALLAGGLLAISSVSSKAQLLNGSFETGDFTDWTLGGNASTTFVESSGFNGYAPESGTYFAALGAVGSLDYLSQTVATTPGQTYVLAYFLASNGTTPNEFLSNAGPAGGLLIDGLPSGGQTFSDQVNIPDSSGYVEYSYLYTPTTSLTQITFESRDDPAYLALDHASFNLAAVPEPSTWSFVLIGVCVIVVAQVRRVRAAAQG